MRYENWDVLLFPGESKVPIQEFSTKFHVLQGTHDTTASQKVVHSNDVEAKLLDTLNQTPILTCFVASLRAGTPFRVSVHSWDRPKPSQLLADSKTSNELVLYEARIYMDAILVAQRTFGEKTSWPEVIDSMQNPSMNHVSSTLCFPSFHPSVLGQSHWDASDGFGRIRVVISEGVLRTSDRPLSQKYSYDLLRDIIWFSFQHAPRNILDQAAIAWPNTKAFQNLIQRVNSAPDYDAHAHSPRKAHRATCVTPSCNKAGVYLPNIELRGLTSLSTIDNENPNSKFEDPFIEPNTVIQDKSKRKFGSDITMSDLDSGTSRTDMSDVVAPKTDFQEQINQAAVTEIVNALSPSKKIELLNILSPDVAGIDKNLPGCRQHGNATTPVTLSKTTQDEDLQRAVSSSSAGTSCVSGYSNAPSWNNNCSIMNEDWPSGEFPGLLGVMQSGISRRRSDSSTSKRKRSLSPAASQLWPTRKGVHAKHRSISPVKPQAQKLGNEKKTVRGEVIPLD